MNLQQIGEAVERLALFCYCGESIKADQIRSYSHKGKGAIEVEGFSEKQWVFFECPGCGRQLRSRDFTNLADVRRNIRQFLKIQEASPL